MSIKTYKIATILFYVMMTLSGIGLFWSALYDETYTKLFSIIFLTSTVGIGVTAISFIVGLLNDGE